MSTEIESAEKRGYSRGYAAGRRRVQRDRDRQRRKQREDALWQRAFLAALPAAITVSGWTRGDTPIATMTDRVDLAARVADRALRCAVLRGRF